MASEFVTGAITSGGPPYDYFMSLMPQNPHVRFFESRLQGYTVCDLTLDRWRTDFYAVDHTVAHKPSRTNIASFEVTPGDPEPVKV